MHAEGAQQALWREDFERFAKGDQALTCDRVAVLDKGHLVALGKPFDVLTPERLLCTFGVHARYLTDPFDGARILRFRAP